MRVYKIWIEIEEIDEENGVYEDAAEPISIGGEFDTLEEAIAFRVDLINRG